jgi:hypothetical protein
MATKQQTSVYETNGERNGYTTGKLAPEHNLRLSDSSLSHEHKSTGVDFTMLSLVSAFVAITLTLMIALISPRGPVAQKLIETAVTEPTVQDAPVTSTLEVPSQPTGDKRFMDGLEVEPAPPSVSDPFSVRGNKAK